MPSSSKTYLLEATDMTDLSETLSDYLVRELERYGVAVRDHTEILQALLQKKPKLAGRLLERNWRSGMESVLRRLEEPGQTHAE